MRGCLKKYLLPFMILSLFLVFAGCSSKNVSIKYEPKDGTGEGYKAKTPLNIAVIPYLDQRTGISSKNKVADIATNVIGVHSSELSLDEDIAAFVTNALTTQLNYSGYTAQIIPSLSFNKALSKTSFSALPADTNLVIGGEINRFHLQVSGRDKMEIELLTTIYDRNSGKVVWTGTTIEETDRYAGTMGNTVKALTKYINKTLNAALKKLQKDSEPAIMRFAMRTGTSPYVQATEISGQDHLPPMQREAETVQSGIFKITSKPTDAKFYINDAYYGKTPLTLELKPGTYEVTVKLRGFKDEREKVAIRAGVTTELEVLFGE